ncbi:YHYH protein [Pseudooceanicola sp.]|uniref:YHYH protein n=1 Tax=Pseudooceanicola sp. TaxID=1914328 RepID=UPI002606A9DA|nr:YHYH protein [Pseudooceanicola sp.]MDF1855847.1 YHYH protein [Pseudooceanicola sp.]
MRPNQATHPVLPFVAAAVLAIGPARAQPTETDLARIASFFATAQVVEGPSLVDCTLSGDTKTTCFSITVSHVPRTYTPGPWCPTNIADGADAGGIWFLDGETVDVDGAFIASLAEVYGDTNWQLFDPDTGAVRFTGTLESCEAAARPDVDPAYQNSCVQCLPEYLPEGTALTYVIPLVPVPTQRPAPTNRGGSGIALNGVRLDGPAPVDAILGAYTIAPFDDCGGHVNPHVGYHYHAVTDCLTGVPTTIAGATSDAVAAHGGQIGIAMDGHAIFAHLMADGQAPQGLDACHGHAAEGLPYHYHAGAAGSNQILGCLAAETGCTLVEGQTVCDASRPPPRP